ncbi:CaiB/BaiF CoA-transferase family protein [Terasakiella sp. A23]|uniref:CaiB/BaiF CoA transferase family protein n=1 Tax=Terasakiella sp. FCG-A23 TaxID=3080561 RepID=UPI0029556511|nr:CaiB/BaiF CoA-transferase family protein [Terasakiella sp. A23]MDV7340602.1 CaiB/BaiF CoA-transferase family protein [Terasakiella sp. A23]
MAGPLSHIRVLDLSRILAGPWASQTLGDMGAEIIKIERPHAGDDTRRWGPPYVKDQNGQDTDDAAYFMSANRNKRSVAIDMATEEGQKLIHQLVAECDVVIENFKVGGLKKYKLDYESLKQVKPDIVYCSITGFGQTGPYANRAGYDFLIQGMGGLMSVTGEADGGPVKVGVALSDVMTGLYAVIGIQAALAHRNRTGEGQHVDLSLLDVQVATLANQSMNYLTGGIVPGRMGNAHPNIVPYQAFATSDGHMILAVGNDSQFAKFCEVAGLDDVGGDNRFKTNAGRVEHRETLIPLLQTRIAKDKLDWWIAELETAQVPCGPINTIDRVFADPQVQARDMLVELDHPVAGKVPQVGSPLKFSETPVVYEEAPPVLAHDTADVLREILDLSDAELDELAVNNVVQLKTR